MNRRHFLSATASSIAAAAFPFDAAAANISVADRFHAARARNPRLAGFSNAPGEFDLAAVKLEGRIPEALRGVFYRNGSAQHERAGVRYHHWFDGDGLVHRWQIGEAGVGYRGRFVATPKRQAEVAAGEFLFPAGGGGIPARAALTGPDSINVANTNILPVNGEVWALWEGGSASRLDGTTLAFKEFVAFNDDLRGAPFSAHPRIGEDGRIWNLGYFGDKLVIYRLSTAGALEAAKLHNSPEVGLLHDFLLTERSVVIVYSSTRLGAGDNDGLFTRVNARPDLPMQVKVFDRETLALTREAELPAGYVFHFGNAWEEKDGTIHFDMVHTTNCNEVKEMMKPMRGELPAVDSNMLSVVLPMVGAPRVARLRQGVEFPRISPTVRSQRNHYVYAAAQEIPGYSTWYDAVAKIDTETGKTALARYGNNWMVEEHVFVPRPGGSGEDDGWLIGTALNWKRQQTALSIFDARRLDDGPVARAWLDVAMPLGFHGQFVPSINDKG